MTLQEWREEMRQDELRRRFGERLQQEFSKAGVPTSGDARETAFNINRWLRGQLASHTHG